MPQHINQYPSIRIFCKLLRHFLIFILLSHETRAFVSPTRYTFHHRFHDSSILIPTRNAYCTGKRISHPSIFPLSKVVPSSTTTAIHFTPSSTLMSASEHLLESMTREQAEMIAGPFFGASLFPYLLFLYFLNVPNNQTPKGVVVGFATCLLFVFLTIPAAIAAQSLYGVSLADSDWLHGSAESLLTITNIITCLGFRQALSSSYRWKEDSYLPMIFWVLVWTGMAGLSAWIPATFFGALSQVHFPYLGGWLSVSPDVLGSIMTLGGTMNVNMEPANALTVECWIIHISSLVEFLIAMGFVCTF